MARWAPGAEERLRAAALDLFAEEGYEQVTVAQLARRAGVTERTFYRYFTDKREVLFAGSLQLQAQMVAAVAAAPEGTAERDLVRLALDALAGMFTPERRSFARRRQAVLYSQPALLERELLKLASLKAALADALAGRGVPAERAALAAELTTGVFHVSFGAWVAEGEERDLAELQRHTLHRLRELLGDD